VIGNKATPIEIYLANFDDNSRKVTIRCIDQNSSKYWHQDINISANSEERTPLYIPPSIDRGDHNFYIEFFENNEKIHSDNVTLYVLDEDHVLFQVHDIGHDWYFNSYEAIGCWITPDEPSIKKWIDSSFDSTSQKHNIREDVKSLWGHLKSLNFSYVATSYSIGENKRNHYQKINIPKNTLTSRNGNCIDLSVLFASAMEAIGYDPIICLVSNPDPHAFLGWENEERKLEFLETTVIDDKTFEEAMDFGKYQYEIHRHKFNEIYTDTYKLLKISDIRKKKYFPIF